MNSLKDLSQFVSDLKNLGVSQFKLKFSDHSPELEVWMGEKEQAGPSKSVEIPKVSEETMKQLAAQTKLLELEELKLNDPVAYEEVIAKSLMQPEQNISPELADNI